MIGQLHTPSQIHLLSLILCDDLTTAVRAKLPEYQRRAQRIIDEEEKKREYALQEARAEACAMQTAKLSTSNRKSVGGYGGGVGVDRCADHDDDWLATAARGGGRGGGKKGGKKKGAKKGNGGKGAASKGHSSRTKSLSGAHDEDDHSDQGGVLHDHNRETAHGSGQLGAGEGESTSLLTPPRPIGRPPAAKSVPPVCGEKNDRDVVDEGVDGAGRGHTVAVSLSHQAPPPSLLAPAPPSSTHAPPPSPPICAAADPPTDAPGPDQTHECFVCLLPPSSSIEDDNDKDVCTLTCTHTFHHDCLDVWAEVCGRKGIDATCPYCRGPLRRREAA